MAQSCLDRLGMCRQGFIQGLSDHPSAAAIRGKPAIQDLVQGLVGC